MAGKHLSLLVHFVWSTGGREPWITAEWNHRLFGFIGGVLRHDGVKLIGAGGMSDHVHLYTSLPSTISIAKLVNSDKIKFVALGARDVSKQTRLRMAARIWSL